MPNNSNMKLDAGNKFVDKCFTEVPFDGSLLLLAYLVSNTLCFLTGSAS